MFSSRWCGRGEVGRSRRHIARRGASGKDGGTAAARWSHRGRVQSDLRCRPRHHRPRRQRPRRPANGKEVFSEDVDTNRWFLPRCDVGRSVTKRWAKRGRSTGGQNMEEAQRETLLSFLSTEIKIEIEMVFFGNSAQPCHVDSPRGRPRGFT